eukprot:gene15734-7029_t
MDLFKKDSVVLTTQEPNEIQSMSLRRSKSGEAPLRKIETSSLNDVVATTADILITTKARTESTSLPDVITSTEKTCAKGSKLVGPLKVDQTETTWSALEKELDYIKNGGFYNPPHCNPAVKTAVIIPYRDREKHLKTFLKHVYPMLTRQNIFFQIFVIEQADANEFNRGKLMNVGFKEALKVMDFNCFVFHDVDLIPEDDRNLYGCHISPAHLSPAIDKFGYSLFYKTIFGGVEMFKKGDFEKINGFSNIFWGWGGEDDSLYQRITSHGYNLRRPAMSIGRYIMIKHEQAPKNEKRDFLLHHANIDSKDDGLNSLKYKVKFSAAHPLYTRIHVDLLKEADILLGT